MISPLSLTATCVALLMVSAAHATTTTLEADSGRNAYDVINDVLAPGHDVCETPDCGHGDFGDHITQEYNDELGKDVFQFHIHVDDDDDRCINDDRQRNEIKTYEESPECLVGFDGDSFTYTWKVRLPEGFQPSPSFTHIHQLKPVGGDYDSIPTLTLTARAGDPDMMELRYAEELDQETIWETELDNLIGQWVTITESVTFTDGGDYHIEMCGSDGCFFEHSTNRNFYKEGADFMRPKWGIYRSLDDEDDLRDEVVEYADFVIEGPDC